MFVELNVKTPVATVPPLEIESELRMSRPKVFSTENWFGVSQAWGQLHSQCWSGVGCLLLSLSQLVHIFSHEM